MSDNELHVKVDVDETDDPLEDQWIFNSTITTPKGILVSASAYLPDSLTSFSVARAAAETVARAASTVATNITRNGR